MRMYLPVAAATMLGLTFSASAAKAEITYPWCAQYGMQGTSNCGFSTPDQCRAALSGNGGYCELNPAYRPGVDPLLVPRRPRR